MAASSPTVAIAAEGLRKTYGPHEAVKHLDFRIERGEIVGLF